MIGSKTLSNRVRPPAIRSIDDQVMTMRLQAIALAVIAGTSWLMELASAEDRLLPAPPNQPYPTGSEITFEWIYSCTKTRPCSFSCAGSGSANGVTALQIYLGTTPLGSNSKSPALFYFYSTASVQRNSGFRISTGIQSTLSCDVVGMTLDYSGPPK